MTITPEKYLRKPVTVEAVQVTDKNIFEVAMWCQGEIQWKTHPDGQGDPGTVDHIRVRVHSPVNDRQKKAYVGDWVLYSNRGYKIYTDRAFKNSFDLEPTQELKKAWVEFKDAIGVVNIREDPNVPEGKFRLVGDTNINEAGRKYYRGHPGNPRLTKDELDQKHNGGSNR